MHKKISGLAVLVVLTLAGAAAPAQASHSWGDWHWQRAANPVTLEVRDSTTATGTAIGGPDWPSMLRRSATDWTQSSVLDLAVQPQTAADLAVQQGCPFEPGAIRVCNVYNPDVTWLGLATVLPDVTSGDGHVAAATAQTNDTWFSTGLYDDTAAQQVLCQEVGHTLGLNHQDENFNNASLGTCMDYTNNPLGPPSNEHPNAHDYEQLEAIYAHLDSTTTIGAALPASAPPAMGQIDFDTPGQWGRLVRSSGNGRVQIFELDFGGGNRVVTHVFWADPENDARVAR